MKQHTPGPWEVYEPFILESDKAKYWVRAKDPKASGPAIAEVFDWHLDPKQNEANARLIAAAPELLEVARKVGPAIQTLLDEAAGKEATGWGIVNVCLILAKAAIAKATQ